MEAQPLPPQEQVTPGQGGVACLWRARRWHDGQQHVKPGLRPALLRLALASLLQPRLAADAGSAHLPGDVVGVVVAALGCVLRFCGVLVGHDRLLHCTKPTECEQTLVHSEMVISVAFSPDCPQIVIASGGDTSFDKTAVSEEEEEEEEERTGESDTVHIAHRTVYTPDLSYLTGGWGLVA
jgi:hypothetical protein